MAGRDDPSVVSQRSVPRDLAAQFAHLGGPKCGNPPADGRTSKEHGRKIGAIATA